jgi:choline dehydrogenase
MGKSEDLEAVADSNAAFTSLSALQVVDTSSFAFLPPGHPQSTVYAFAENISNKPKAIFAK